jgi:two-component system sensor histidine kinase UhpB
VTVSDNGQGMHPASGVGYGLLGMSERVKAMGGCLDVSSRPGEGLRVVAKLPQPRRERVLVPAAVAT